MIITIVLIGFGVLIAGSLIGWYLGKRDKQFTDEELGIISSAIKKQIALRDFQRIGETTGHSISAEDFRKLYQKHYGVVIMAHTDWCESWLENNKGNCRESNCPNYKDCDEYTKSIGIYSSTGEIDFLKEV